MSPADREAFVAKRTDRWGRLEQLVETGPAGGSEWAELAASYRALCADLATARAAGFPADVTGYLDDLAGRAHNVLYSVRPTSLGRSIVSDVWIAFPRELRANLAFFLLATALFYGPLALGLLGAVGDHTFASRVLSPEQLAEMEKAYSGDLARGGTLDAAMGGYYVWNNVGIAFRVFATGIFFGAGSIFYLVYNGLVIGTLMGYLGSIGLGGTLLEYVSGHSAWELTGICVSGTAGLRLGWTLIATNGRTRLGALREVGPSLYRLILGTVVMLLIAASIEGFWSAGPVPRAGKLAFGAVQVVLVASWLALGGRGQEKP